MSATDVLGLVGSTVDPIRFDECIDTGGFGIVYRGQHVGFGEPVAIKCLRLSKLVSVTEGVRASIVQRFREESKTLPRLSHGNHDIVRCIAAGELFAPSTGEPIPYFVNEWVDGRQLSADLTERRDRGLQGRTLRETLDLVESAALALAYAHTQGVVHRDVTPRNLMLTRTRGGLRLKVLDFGIASILDDPGLGQSMTTADGIHLYTPAYCAPEQLSAQVGDIGPWTDIYSLTLVLLEVMRGEKIRHPGAPSLRASSLGLTLPPPIEDLLARAVAQDPLERPANAGVFWSALRELTRQSVPPVSNAAALAATAYDGNVAEAMLKVRAATAAANGATAMQASPWTGTMLMVNAPSGALHVFTPEVSAKDESPVPGSTAPLAMPAAQPGNPAARAASPSPSTAPALSPHAVTAGIAMPSPLASSLGPGVASPVAIAAPGSVPPAILAVTPALGPAHENDAMRAARPVAPRPQPVAPPAQPPVAQPSGNRGSTNPPTVPSVLPTVQPRGNGLVIGILVFLVLAVLAAAGVMLLRRPR